MNKRDPSEGSKDKKPVIRISVAAFALIAIASGIWFSGLADHLAGHGAKKTLASVPEVPALVDIPDIISNLDTGSRRASFIKLHAKIQVSHAADVLAIQAATSQILDIFQTYLRSTRPEELRGGGGTYRLREALMNRIDTVVAPVQVTDILFTEVLVQ